MVTQLFKTLYEHFPSHQPHVLYYDLSVEALVLGLQLGSGMEYFNILESEVSDPEQLVKDIDAILAAP